MTTMILNSIEFEFAFYNRNTYFSGANITSTANINQIKGDNIAEKLTALAQETITSLKIKKDNEIIYSLENLNAQIQSFDESFDGEVFNVNLNINFNT